MMDQYRDNITHKKMTHAYNHHLFLFCYLSIKPKNEIGRNVCSILSLSKYVVGSDILPRMCMW